MKLRRQTPQGKLKRAAQTVVALPLAAKGLAIAGAGAVLGGIAALGNRRSRRAVKGVAAKATAPVRRAGRDYDDVTLARKVESEIFRDPDVPKGAISVNAHNGTVELRGALERDDQIEALGKAASKVRGVKGVNNLLHTPGSEPPHSPVSDPDDVRARASGD
jgi:osmotically-inducible protein OsmY